ncbi:hypothetical protein VIBRN418_02107 [Vibrio sp. N418]|uniref:hypothetical protein n=1 Tax=Vibrio sp. (strain N418) TaxID=701176 RepID=UPI00021C06EA|nr:hypothetical protein [Vibrio sp. N418]EGU35691.1 hypothetical protein VIBRN418_02107 [Vibrio sp. N418]
MNNTNLDSVEDVATNQPVAYENSERKLASPVNEKLQNKLLGPLCDEIGTDFLTLYQLAKAKLLMKAANKSPSYENDHKKANPRVAVDVIMNGSLTSSEICAEYFGGALASSRTNDGENDDALHYVSIIKTLSSRQLKLHYIIYNAFNKHLVRNNKDFNIHVSGEMKNNNIIFLYTELFTTLGFDFNESLNILYKEGLIQSWESRIEIDTNLNHVKVIPTLTGLALYCVAHNKLNNIESFKKIEFGDFEEITLPSYSTDSMTNHKCKFVASE